MIASALKCVVGLIGRTVCKTVRPMLSDRCLSCPVSVCNVGVLWPNGWMDQDETWHGGRPRPRSHCVRWGPSYSPKSGHSPQFSAYVRCGQTAAWTKMAPGTEVGLGPGDIVLYGDPAPPKKGHSSQFSAHVYCTQTAGWIKMLMGTEPGGRPRPCRRHCTQLIPLFS